MNERTALAERLQMRSAIFRATARVRQRLLPWGLMRRRHRPRYAVAAPILPPLRRTPRRELLNRSFQRFLTCPDAPRRNGSLPAAFV